MDTSNFFKPLFWWQQKTPSKLKPNCLLTRYPLYFLAEPNSLLEYLDPWNGIPQFLRDHGYDVKVISKIAEIKSVDAKIHLISDGTLSTKALKILSSPQNPKIFSSITLVNPVFDFESDAVFLENFEVPAQLLLGSLRSSGVLAPLSRASQRIAKSWGPSFNIYDGTDFQLKGRGPRPAGCVSAHEFFLQHCIFLAEYDLTTAE